MEIIALLGGVACIVLALCFFIEDHPQAAALFTLLAVLLQLFWAPQFFEPRVKRYTSIMNNHDNYEFDRPVKLTKIHTYKPLSAFSSETRYMVEFIN